MKKIAVILDPSMLKTLVNQQRRAKELRYDERLLELIGTEKLIAYITQYSVQSLMSYLNQEIQDERTSRKRVSVALEKYKINIKDIEESTLLFDSHLLGVFRKEIMQSLSLALALDIDVLLQNDLERLKEMKNMIQQQPNLFKKLWVLTPRLFLKLYDRQQKYEQQNRIESDQGWQYAFKNISSEEELTQIHQFEVDSLPANTSLNRDKLREWWQTYPMGLKSLFLGNQLIAVASIWPISEESAQYLRSSIDKGTFLENQLDVMPYQFDKVCKFWYIGGVYLKEEFRTKGGLSIGILQDFLAKTFLDWLKDGENSFVPCLDGEITFFCIPVNSLVFKLLISWGFQQEKGQTEDGFSLFSLSIINHQHLDEMLGKLRIH
jgi:hypothetical protein